MNLQDKSSSILKAHKLTKIFETKKWFKPSTFFTAVNTISFELKKGEILGILGPNGAGKTTTIQMLLGLLTPTSGSITFFDKDIEHHRSEIMQKIGFASSYLKLPGSLSIEENLSLYGRLYGMSSKERKNGIEKVTHFFGIAHIKDKLARNLSAGQLTRLMLAKAFLPNPSIVLLDEPTAALDPDIALQIRKFIKEEKRVSGTSVLFTSHNMSEVEELCDRVLVLKNGSIIANETPANLAAKVKTSRVTLIVIDNIEKLLFYAASNDIPYKKEDALITLDVDEQKIADVLISMASLEIKYSHISIEKPTLEDYFLEILKP